MLHLNAHEHAVEVRNFLLERKKERGHISLWLWHLIILNLCFVYLFINKSIHQRKGGRKKERKKVEKGREKTRQKEKKREGKNRRLRKSVTVNIVKDGKTEKTIFT